MFLETPWKSTFWNSDISIRKILKILKSKFSKIFLRIQITFTKLNNCNWDFIITKSFNLGFLMSKAAVCAVRVRSDAGEWVTSQHDTITIRHAQLTFNLTKFNFRRQPWYTWIFFLEFWQNVSRMTKANGRIE